MRIITWKKFAAILIGLAGGTAFAQHGFEIGVGYMVEKSMLINNSDKGQGSQINKDNTVSYLNGGLTLSYRINSKLAIEADVLRSRQGQAYTGTDPNPTLNTAAYTRNIAIQAALNGESLVGNYQAKAELNGVKVPVLVKLNFGKAGPLSFHLSLGPQINIITGVVYELNHEDIDLPNSGMTPNDAYRHVTIDGVVSPGLCFKLAKHLCLNADLRFDYGFQDVEEKNVQYSYLGTKENYYGSGRSATHNMSIAALVGLSYRL